MNNSEAKTILESMCDTAINDIVSFKARIKELQEDYNADPQPDTAAQIKRTEARLERRINEGAALALAATKFPEPAVEGAPAYHWIGWESEEEMEPGRPDTYFLTICHPDGEEYAVIFHRTFGGQFPLDGDLAKRKEADAQRIVDALNRK